ncbi:MAG: hypothetical protein LPK85_15735, partial [Gammaproteobacteria bacterium]|nr:hypothetical protein [Gammaproteobacteria bacterium]
MINRTARPMMGLAVALACLTATPGQATQTAQAPSLRLMDTSLSTLFSAGCASEPDAVLGQLQGGGHDPKQCGFNFQAAELSLAGAVDPYFEAQAHILFGDGHVELEEAYLRTTQLPWGLEAKAGYYLTEFGRVNPSHPHAWTWVDQPVVSSRLLGGEGIRGAGARLAWLIPGHEDAQIILGAQNANNDTMISFLGAGHSHDHAGGHAHDTHAHDGHAHAGEAATDAGIGGSHVMAREIAGWKDLLWLLRWEQGGALSDSLSWQGGVSGLFGPNRSGPDNQTRVYGADLRLRWQPADNFRGAPALTWQTEWMQRDFEATPATGQARDTRTLRDQGLYTQLLYTFHPAWSSGLRYEQVSGSGELAGHARADDPQRADRWRLSPLLSWSPTHFSRLRLQYNLDDTDTL